MDVLPPGTGRPVVLRPIRTRDVEEARHPCRNPNSEFTDKREMPRTGSVRFRTSAEIRSRHNRLAANPWFALDRGLVQLANKPAQNIRLPVDEGPVSSPGSKTSGVLPDQDWTANVYGRIPCHEFSMHRRHPGPHRSGISQAGTSMFSSMGMTMQDKAGILTIGNHMFLECHALRCVSGSFPNVPSSGNPGNSAVSTAVLLHQLRSDPMILGSTHSLRETGPHQGRPCSPFPPQ